MPRRLVASVALAVSALCVLATGCANPTSPRDCGGGGVGTGSTITCP